MAKKSLRLLFIGNSHTYYNDMPRMVRTRAVEEGYDCEVTMIAHGGWYLSQHVSEPDVRFNILFGNYDYVILQEHAHPFGPEEEYMQAAVQLSLLIREGGSKPVIYACWARKDEREKQEEMNAVNRRVAEGIGALLAPVGENWWTYAQSHPETEMYAPDGAHASEAGSDLAAVYLWNAIRDDLAARKA
ncbi:MAG: SGNH/GDSL hydrolase family protein [Clostridia bacterium]|nr:SGNH/GDSL hydrolase family protein [Clostridia bacterium]MBR1685267.1 SGNH/GDSL hydrolase family protein [Clostridia bacterium]